MALQGLDLCWGGMDPAYAPGARETARLQAFEFRMADLLKVSLAVMAVGQLGRVPVLAAGAKEAPLLLNDLAVVGLLLMGLVLVLRRRRLILDGPSSLAFLFFAVGGISALLAIPRFGLTPFEAVFSLAYLFRWLAYFGIYIFAINFLRREDVPSAWNVLEGTVLLFAVFGIVQSAFLPGFAQIVYPEAELFTQWDPQGHRLVSTFLDPNLAGALVVMILLVQAGRLALGAPVTLWKTLVLLVAALLTVSRSTFLALMIGGLFILAARGLSRRVLRASLLVGLLSIPAIPFLAWMAVSYNKLDLTDPSLLARFVAWGRAIAVLADHPVIGVGFNTYGFVQLRYGFAGLSQSAFGLDGGLLFIAVMTGIIGVTLYTAMIFWVVARCYRVWRDSERSPESRGLCLGATAATVALIVHSLFLNSILYPFLMETLWVLWGLAFVVGRMSGEVSEDPADPAFQ